MEVLNNLRWAIEVSSKLESLDYDVRENTIARIHDVLDSDYAKMGFEVSKASSQRR